MTYEEYQAQLEEAQAGKSRSEIKEDLASRFEYTLDLDSIPAQGHFWVHRGLKISCEGANHPNHHVFLRH